VRARARQREIKSKWVREGRRGTGTERERERKSEREREIEREIERRGEK